MKRAALATIVIALAVLLTIPPRNRAAGIEGFPDAASSGTFTVFNAPDAGTAALDGTGGLSVNSVGTVTGGYIVTGNVTHGFVRSAGGTIKEFDAPGAGTSKNQGTFPTSINSGGTVTGIVSDANNVYHGFVRTPLGSISIFDAPGATLGGHAGTVPMSINTAGTITGMYRDASLVYHGFVRTSSSFASFDAPGAGTGLAQGTQPLSINSAGVITGYYRDASYVNHGFVRAANGVIKTFDAPGAGTAPGTFKGLKFQGTVAVSINAGGAIAGTFGDANFVNHGFIRAADGTFTVFDAPLAGGLGTFSTVSGSINTWGGVAGAVQDAGGVFHLFLRTPDGTITNFDAPGAGGAGVFDGTGGFSLNDSWVVTGLFADPSVVLHGFVFTPPPFAWTSLSATSLTFAKQAIDTASTAKNVTLTSAGSGSLTPVSISITGADPGDFSQTNNCPLTLAPKKKCTISVTFFPKALGTRTATLSISDNASNSPQTVSLTGSSVKQAVVSPTSLTFLAQSVGTTSTAKAVTLTNNLATALTINGISFTGADPGDFAQTNTCAGSVLAKGKCTISVTFKPIATGTRTATLTTSDSANNSPQTVAVTGTGK